MKTLVLILLALAPAAIPALQASPDFRVELFSNLVVTSLTLQATDQSVSICGSKTDGPCLVLPPTQKISCFSDLSIHCRRDTADRALTLLTINSTTPFRISPAIAKLNDPPQTFLLRNARVTITSGSMQVSTQVDLESYVSGVLRGEASVVRTPAARQAMAILARTWALRWQGRHGGQGFDFCSLTHCQVFRPPQAREADAPDGLDPAVRATRGRVLQYQGVLTDPYFTACCGGLTEAAGNVWPDRAQPYLISVHDPYCLTSSHGAWKQMLTAASLQQILRESMHLPTAVPLTDLSVEKRDSSGRALVLRAVAGATWDVDANQFRYALDRRLGWEQIKSNLYTIQRQGDLWVFTGHGLGHGVGLCQAGAEQMARRGSSTEYILGTYFPGTEIALQPSGDSDPIASSEHFELVYLSSQGPWVKQTLDTLEQWRKELGAHAEVLPSRVHVETWASVADFTRVTGEPGWMAASSDGQSIALQPLELLGRKRILNQTLRHELTHLVVHRLRAQGVPRWFEEGSVLYLTGERIETPAIALETPQELEEAVSKPRSEAEMKAAYAQALERVRQFARQRGDADLWRLLAHPSDTDLRRIQ
ncbi:MAG TPA: SpoIID/LytB domain-containing protein [Terriglobia bacterium]|nr:SpoIID/LytB domain-containing protein [Terriglobia bacterium]